MTQHLSFLIPSGSVKKVREAVGRLAGAASGQVTSCVLSGPPLSAVMDVSVPEDRATRVLEVAGKIGATRL